MNGVRIKLLRKTYIALFIVFIFGIINWQKPVVRFENYILNQMFMLLIFFIPTILTILSFLIFKNIYIKILLLLISIMPCLIGLLFSFFVVTNIFATYKLGYDPSFEQIHKINMKYYQVSIYRTDGGAMTSFGIIARQEKVIFPGILLVKNFFSAYPGSDVEYQKIDNKALLINGRKYFFKENVYF